MARFCSNCGSVIEDGFSFCMECGTPLPKDETASSPFAPAADDGGIFAAPAADSGFAAAAVPSKPMPKGVKIALIAVAALAIVLIALSTILGRVFSAQSARDDFIDALIAGDAATIIEKTAVSDENIVLTEENLAPLFALCEADTSVIPAYGEYLDENGKYAEKGDSQNAEYPLTFNVKDYILFKKYQVCINTGSLYIETPLANAQISVDGKTLTATPISNYAGDSASDQYTVNFPTAGDAATSSSTVYGLLPGLYDVNCVYTDYFGNEITWSGSVSLKLRSAEVYTSMDYVSTTIYNNYAHDIQVSCGNGSITLPSECSITLYPVASFATVTASCEPIEGNYFETSYPIREFGYYEPYFESCDLYVHNDYYAEVIPTVTTPSGKVYDLASVPAYSGFNYNLVPVGSSLSVDLADSDSFPCPEYSLYPMVMENAGNHVASAYFYLTENEKQALVDYVNRYAEYLLALVAENNMDALMSMPYNALVDLMVSHVAPTFSQYQTSVAITIAEDYEIPLQIQNSGSGSLALVAPMYTVEFTFVDAEGEVFKEPYTFSDSTFFFTENGWSYLPE